MPNLSNAPNGMITLKKSQMGVDLFDGVDDHTRSQYKTVLDRILATPCLVSFLNESHAPQANSMYVSFDDVCPEQLWVSVPTRTCSLCAFVMSEENSHNVLIVERYTLNSGVFRYLTLVHASNRCFQRAYDDNKKFYCFFHRLCLSCIKHTCVFFERYSATELESSITGALSEWLHTGIERIIEEYANVYVHPRIVVDK